MAFNIVYNLIPEAAGVFGADALTGAIMATYPYPAEVPAEAISLLVAVAVFVFVSLATQNRDGNTLPADLHALIER